MVSDQPVSTPRPDGAAPEKDDAAEAAEQMQAATEKLRAKLPMMKGEAIPKQPAGS